MKKVISVILSLLLFISVLPIEMVSVFSADEITVTTGAEFVSKVLSNGGSYKIEGTEILADGSIGIILPNDYVPLTNFYGTISGVSGKNNIQLSSNGKALIETLNAKSAAATGQTTIENIVLKNYELNGVKTPVSVGLASGGMAALVCQVPKTIYQLDISNVINYADVNNTGSANGTAALVGYVVAGSGSVNINIKSCKNFGKILSAAKHTAGLFGGLAPHKGANRTLIIENSYNYGKVSQTASNGATAGIFGGLNGATFLSCDVDIIKCGNFGEIDGGSGEGTAGIVANAIKNVTVSESFNAGEIKGTNTAYAGIMHIYGSGNEGTLFVSDSFNSGAVNGEDYNYGIVVGSHTATNISRCYNAGALSGTHNSHIGLQTGYTNCYTKDEIETLALTETLPSGFESSVWQYNVNENAVSGFGYLYPQHKENLVYFDYKMGNDTKEYDLMPFSTESGTITNADSVYDFSYGAKMNPDEFSQISEFATYKGLAGTKIIVDSDKQFTVNKSIALYVASEFAPSGYTQIMSKDNVAAQVADRYGNKINLYKKDIAVMTGQTESVIVPENAKGVFLAWLDSVSITYSNFLNGTVKFDNSDTPKDVYIQGSNVTLTVTPDAGYYLKKLSVNGVNKLENKGSEETLILTLSENTNIAAVFEKYQPLLSLKLNFDTSKRVSFVVDAMEFMANESVVFKVKDKDGNNLSPLYEKTVILDTYGKGTLETPFDYPSENYEIEADITLNGTHLTFNLDDNDASNGELYYIPSVQSIMMLINKLNTDITSINKNELVNDILTDSDLSFEKQVFEKLDNKIDAVERFLAYNDGAYSTDNLGDRFNNSVIFSALNSGNSSSISSAITFYDASYIKLNDTLTGLNEGDIYNDYLALTDKSKVYTFMAEYTYSSLSDIVNNFKYSVIIAKLNNVLNSSDMLPILLKYYYDTNNPDGINDILDISQIKSIDNYTDFRQRKALEYLSDNLSDVKTITDLKNMLIYIAGNIDTIASSSSIGTSGGATGGTSSSVTVGGGGGGGGSLPSSIGKTENIYDKYQDVKEEESSGNNLPETEVIYFNDFSDEVAGNSPSSVVVGGTEGSVKVTTYEGKGNVLKITDTTDGYEAMSVTKTFLPTLEPIAIEFEYMCESGDPDVGIRLVAGGSSATAFQLYTSYSNLAYDNKTGTRVYVPARSFPLEKGKWYNVRMIIDVANNSFNLVIQSDVFKTADLSAIPKTYTVDKEKGIIKSGFLELSGAFSGAISKATFKTGRYKSVFLLSHIKVEKNPQDIILRSSVKSPDAPTVTAPVPHAVKGEINIKLNGQYVYSYIKPIMVNNRVLVSVRNILEMFDMEVTWDEETQTVTAKNEHNLMQMKNNDTNILFNGEIKTTDVPAQLYGDRIYVPLRFLSECFGMTVDWDNDTQTVIIGG